jgi:hypothetical protein
MSSVTIVVEKLILGCIGRLGSEKTRFWKIDVDYKCVKRCQNVWRLPYYGRIQSTVASSHLCVTYSFQVIIPFSLYQPHVVPIP